MESHDQAQESCVHVFYVPHNIELWFKHLSGLHFQSEKLDQRNYKIPSC